MDSCCAVYFEWNSSPDVPETGRAEGEIEQKDVSNWTFSGLSPGLRLDFNALHTSDVFGSRKATLRDRRGNTGPADMELHAQWPQVMKRIAKIVETVACLSNNLTLIMSSYVKMIHC